MNNNNRISNVYNKTALKKKKRLIKNIEGHIPLVKLIFSIFITYKVKHLKPFLSLF